MSEPDHDALVVRGEWLRALGLAEDEVAALADRLPAPSLAEELEDLWAVRRHPPRDAATLRALACRRPEGPP